MLPMTDEEELLIDFVRLHNRLISRVINPGISRISLDGCMNTEATVAAAREALNGITLLMKMMEGDSILRLRAHSESFTAATRFSYAILQLHAVMDLQDAIPAGMADRIDEIHSDAASFLGRPSEGDPFLTYEDEIPF